MDTIEDFDFSEFIDEKTCKVCGRSVSSYIIPFDMRGYICANEADCLQAWRSKLPSARVP